MISKLLGYRDDHGRLEVEVVMTSGAQRSFIVREDDLYEGQLTFTALPPEERASWTSWTTSSSEKSS